MKIGLFVKQCVEELNLKGDIEKEFVSIYRNIYALALESNEEIHDGFEAMCREQYSKKYLDYYFHMWEHCCVKLGIGK